MLGSVYKYIVLLKAIENRVNAGQAPLANVLPNVKSPFGFF